MRNSLLMRAARASLAATLFFSLDFAPALAHGASASRGGPVGRTAFRHGQPFGFHSFNPNGFDHHFFDSRFEGNRRFARNGFRRNALFFGQAGVFGCCGWSGWSAPDAAPDAPIVVSGGPPVVINFSPPLGAVDIGGGAEACSVIHKLEYNRAGQFVGERQSQAC